VRDHVFVDDVAHVMFDAMTAEGWTNGIYNLGGNHPVSHRRVAELVVNTMMDEGVVEKKNVDAYIRPIDMPADLRAKFQFHTFAEGQLSSVSAITEGNEQKMVAYVRSLIAHNK